LFKIFSKKAIVALRNISKEKTIYESSKTDSSSCIEEKIFLHFLSNTDQLEKTAKKNNFMLNRLIHDRLRSIGAQVFRLRQRALGKKFWKIIEYKICSYGKL
jgi:hypothetical protein